MRTGIFVLKTVFDVLQNYTSPVTFLSIFVACISFIALVNVVIWVARKKVYWMNDKVNGLKADVDDIYKVMATKEELHNFRSEWKEEIRNNRQEHKEMLDKMVQLMMVQARIAEKVGVDKK